MNKKNLKYYNIASKIESKIRTYNSLDEIMLPSERELAKAFEVSRVTIRKALEKLEGKKLVVRQQGKGTFINQRKITQPIVESVSFSRLAEEHGLVSNTELVEAKMRIANQNDVELLSLNSNESKAIVYVARKRYLNGQLVSLEISYFKNDFSFLLDYDLEQCSLYNIIHKRGYELKIQSRTIEIIEADNFLSKQLNIKVGTPILLMLGRIKDQNNITINYVQEFLLADKFKFEL